MIFMASKSEALGTGAKEKLLEMRRQLKKRTPKFIRVDAHKRKRLEKVWRRPKGRHTKMRDQKRGARKRVEPGFRTPRGVRGLSRSGYEPVMVNTPSDIEGIDSRTQAALLSATLGQKKRVEVVNAALKRNIKILNMKEPEAFLDGVKERFAKKKAAEKEKEKKTKEKKAKAKSIESVVEKEAKPASTKEKTKPKKATKKEAAKKEAAKDGGPEEKAKQEQKKRDKILTKK